DLPTDANSHVKMKLELLENKTGVKVTTEWNGITALRTMGDMTVDGAALNSFGIHVNKRVAEGDSYRLDNIAIYHETPEGQEPGTEPEPVPDEYEYVSGTNVIYEQNMDKLSTSPSEFKYSVVQANGAQAFDAYGQPMTYADDVVSEYVGDKAMELKLLTDGSIAWYVKPTGGIPVSKTKATYIEFDFYSEQANSQDWAIAIGTNTDHNHLTKRPIMYHKSEVLNAAWVSVGTRKALPTDAYSHVKLTLELEENGGNVKVTAEWNGMKAVNSMGLTSNGANLDGFGIQVNKNANGGSFRIDNIIIHQETSDMKIEFASGVNLSAPVSYVLETEAELAASDAEARAIYLGGDKLYAELTKSGDTYVPAIYADGTKYSTDAAFDADDKIAIKLKIDVLNAADESKLYAKFYDAEGTEPDTWSAVTDTVSLSELLGADVFDYIKYNTEDITIENGASLMATAEGLVMTDSSKDGNKASASFVNNHTGNYVILPVAIAKDASGKEVGRKEGTKTVVSAFGGTAEINGFGYDTLPDGAVSVEIVYLNYFTKSEFKGYEGKLLID
ncbi:MAG: hypothetical protein IJ454_00630, partial [Clostridia bacterium]|nr:hypothetical protein [Clostridia bacterium]